MRLQFHTDDVAERDQFAYWHDQICQDLLHVTPRSPGGGQRFKASIDVHIAGRFQLATMTASHGDVEKTNANINRDTGESVLLYQALSHDQHYRLGADEFAMMPGDVCIVPMHRRYSGTAEALAARLVLIPKAVLSPLLSAGEVTGAHFLGRNTPFGVMLGASLASVASQLPSLDEKMGNAVLNNLGGLVALALHASEQGRQVGRAGAQAARLAGLKLYIERHLSDPLLTPARAAAALAMSVRQLHLSFEPTGESFARHVLERRLAACMASLSEPLEAGRSVADIAFGWGFNSLSVFYRSFAAAHGTSPGRVRPIVGSG